jgi:hypothetical protein
MSVNLSKATVNFGKQVRPLSAWESLSVLYIYMESYRIGIEQRQPNDCLLMMYYFQQNQNEKYQRKV